MGSFEGKIRAGSGNGREKVNERNGFGAKRLCVKMSQWRGEKYSAERDAERGPQGEGGGDPPSPRLRRGLRYAPREAVKKSRDGWVGHASEEARPRREHSGRPRPDVGVPAGESRAGARSESRSRAGGRRA